VANCDSDCIYFKLDRQSNIGDCTHPDFVENCPLTRIITQQDVKDQKAEDRYNRKADLEYLPLLDSKELREGENNVQRNQKAH
jgi:hypothetical protein